MAVPLSNESIRETTTSQKNFYPVRPNVSSISISFCLCLLGVVGFSLASDQFIHWFVVPVLLCGTLIGTDAVDWFRHRLDTFDPVGLVGLLGLHFFFLAPLLHVYWDYWMPTTATSVMGPPDWRNWLGGMAVLNFLGLLVYRLFRERVSWTRESRLEQRVWVIDKGRFLGALTVSLVVALGVQLLVFSRFGGLGGYIASVESGQGLPGIGWMVMISESFPILTVIGFAVLSRNAKLSRNWFILLLVVLAFLGLQFLFGGLRGSRSNTIWALFWAVGVIHLWVRPIPRVLVYFGVILMVLFMYFYGIYKWAGQDAFQEALHSPAGWTQLEEQTSRTPSYIILTDFGRSGIQALLLYRLTSPEFDYDYAWGRTYLGAVFQVLPNAIWPEPPPTKMKEGTEAQYGRGSYAPGVFESSFVYGLAGETMLNFGPLGVLA